MSLQRCTRCVAEVSWNEDKLCWVNSKDWPVCPQGGPHKVFVPKVDWSDFEKLLTDGD